MIITLIHLTTDDTSLVFFYNKMFINFPNKYPPPPKKKKKKKKVPPTPDLTCLISVTQASYCDLQEVIGANHVL